MYDDRPTPKNQMAKATAHAAKVRGILVTAFVLMFLTGNCDMCSGTNRDYLGDAIDSLDH